MFAYLLVNPLNLVSPFFDPQRLLSFSYGPWIPDQYNSAGTSIFGLAAGYEAVVTVATDRFTPTAIDYVPTPANLKLIGGSTLVIYNYETTPLLGKGTDYGTTLAGSNGVTNYFTVSNSGGTTLVLQGLAVPTGFQIVTAPTVVVPWNQSTLIGIRFAPGAAGTFSGNVFITNNATGSVPFRFAITGTATNPPSPPVISVQPTNQFGVAGSNVLLSVSVTGTPTPSFQWLKNGQAIADATNSTLNLTNLVRASGGIFSVFLTNQLGTTTSSNAIVRVLVPQRFAQAPARLNNGTVRLVFGDPVASTLTTNELTNFVVEATTNVLSTNWVRYTNGFSIVGGMVQFDDPDAPASARRFYRVLER